MQYVRKFAKTTVPNAAMLNTLQRNALGILQADGTWVARPTVSCVNGTSLVIGPCAILYGPTNTPSGVAISPGVTLTPTAPGEGWRYLAAFMEPDHTISFGVTGDAPDEDYRYAGGDSTAMYVCSVRFRTTNTMNRFRFHRGLWLYDWGAADIDSSWQSGTISDNWCTRAGINGAFALVLNQNLGARNQVGQSLVPPHVTNAWMRAKLAASNNATYVRIQTLGNSYENWTVSRKRGERDVRFWLDTRSPSLTLDVNVAGGDVASLAVGVLGFQEP